MFHSYQEPPSSWRLAARLPTALWGPRAGFLPGWGVVLTGGYDTGLEERGEVRGVLLSSSAPGAALPAPRGGLGEGERRLEGWHYHVCL